MVDQLEAAMAATAAAEERAEQTKQSARAAAVAALGAVAHLEDQSKKPLDKLTCVSRAVCLVPGGVRRSRWGVTYVERLGLVGCDICGAVRLGGV
eukprot:7386179-Pyramimonas_sp.AAC.1